MKKYIIALSIFAATLSSCEEFLDVEPVGKMIPTQVEEFANLLHYSYTYSWNYKDNNGGSQLISLADNIEMTDNYIQYEFSPQYVNLDRFAAYAFRQPYQDPTMPDYYLEYGGYKSVAYFNNVIDGVKGIDGGAESTTGKEVMAQAYFGRAWTFLHLAITYGPMYDPAVTNDTRVLPYRTASVPTVANPDLSTTQEMFDLAKSDLEIAIENCPDVSSSPVRANKTAALATLAELYMYQGDWENMYLYAKQAWDAALATKGSIDNLFYDYNTLSYIEPTPMPVPTYPEIDVRTILQISSEDSNHDETYNKENIIYRSTPSHIGLARPNTEYISLFEDGDMRKEMFFLTDLGYTKTLTGLGDGGSDLVITDGFSTYDFRHEKMTANLGISSPTLILTLAEAAARTGKDAEALGYLNSFRKYRYTTQTATLATLTGDNLLEEILAERRRELPIVSCQHYWDLKRYAKEDASKPWVKKSITRTIMGETVTSDINGSDYILTIANSYIEFNPSWGLTINTETYYPYTYL